MVFSDPIFLFLFLPVSIAAIIFARGLMHNITVLIVSFLFYYYSAGSIIFLLIVSVILNYCCGLFIGSINGAKVKERIVIFNILTNLSLLAYFKYAYFVTESISFILPIIDSGLFANIILPIGISFFTFQGISYVVDVYRGHIEPDRNPIRFAAYLTFFPQLIAGPIVRYSDVASDFASPNITKENMAAGATRFFHGLAKKVLVADTAGRVANACFAMSPDETTSVAVFIGALAYTIQIYFDFSGYSDMAIGISRFCGINLLENFNRPYTSSTVTEFWRRWHISLSSWFRDYLYIPLGGSRHGNTKTYRNLVIVFIVTGLWHGAAWTFVFWGVYHGTLLIVERRIWGREAANQSGSLLRPLYLLPVIIIGWIFFRAEGLDQAFGFVSTLAAVWAPDAFVIPVNLRVLLDPFTLSVLALGTTSFFANGRESFGSQIISRVGLRDSSAQLAYLIVAGSVSVIMVLASDFSPFLYFQF
mgnify:CR=1 FL=1